MNSRLKTNAGLSLIELIVVIAIMATLVGLIAPNFLKYLEKNKKEACRQNRTAILKVYERCVYDTSVKIELKTADLGKVIPKLNSASTEFKPTAAEVDRYKLCPLGKETYTRYGVDEENGSAWIVCDKCGDKVALDFLYSAAASPDPETTDKPVVTPKPKSTPSVDETKVWEVQFNTNGHGKFSDTNPQLVNDGEYAKRPNVDLKDPLNTFGGWYKEAGCSNPWDFNTDRVTANITLYAKWEGVSHGEVWPYGDDPTWWDPDMFSHQGEVKSYDLTGTFNNQYVSLKTPSGIFTSLKGGQFVMVDQSSDQKIFYHEALDPEYYSATHQWLVQLTGNVTTYDISDMESSDKVRVKILTTGDLLRFEDGGRTYEYVFWHESANDVDIPISSIRAYENHPSNMYRVNP